MQYTFKRPDPRTGGDNGGGKGNPNKVGFMPGEISSLANDMVLANGGTKENWADYLKDVYSPVKMPRYQYGGGKGKGDKGGGKTDPNKPGTNNDGTGNVTGEFETSNPGHNRAAPMAMPYGVMAGMQPGMGVLSGIPMQQPQMAARQPQMQMPNDGVLAMLRARMGR